MNATRRGLRRDLAVSTIGTAAARATGAIGGVLSARLLGPAGKGEYALLVLVGTAAGTLGTCGLQFWITRQVASPGEGVEVRYVLRRHLVISGVAAVALAGLAVPISTVASIGLGEVFATAAFAFAWIWSMLVLAVTNGLRRMERLASATAAGGGLYILWLFIAMLAQQGSVALVLIAAALANWIVVPLLRRDLCALPNDRRCDRHMTYRAAVRAGLPGMAGELLTLATFRLDIALLAIFVDRTEVGLYAVALSLPELLWMLPDGVAQVVLPHAASTTSRRDTAGIVRLVLSTMAAGGILLGSISAPLITFIFGGSYRAAWTAVPPLLVGAVAMGVWKIVGADLAGRGLLRPRAVSAAVAVATMIVADIILIPSFGIVGAASGSALAYLAAAGLICRAWAAASGGRIAELIPQAARVSFR